MPGYTSAVRILSASVLPLCSSPLLSSHKQPIDSILNAEEGWSNKAEKWLKEKDSYTVLLFHSLNHFVIKKL